MSPPHLQVFWKGGWDAGQMWKARVVLRQSYPARVFAWCCDPSPPGELAAFFRVLQTVIASDPQNNPKIASPPAWHIAWNLHYQSDLGSRYRGFRASASKKQMQKRCTVSRVFIDYKMFLQSSCLPVSILPPFPHWVRQIPAEEVNWPCCEEQEKENITASLCLFTWRCCDVCVGFFSPFAETLIMWVSPGPGLWTPGGGGHSPCGFPLIG